MGKMTGFLLLAGFSLHAVFSGFSVASILYLVIALAVFLFGMFSMKVKALAAAKNKLPVIAFYAAAFALLALVSILSPSSGPFSTSTQINKSSRLIEKGEYEDARKILLKLYEKEPRNALVNQNLAATYLQSYEPDKALKSLDAASASLYFDETVSFNYGLAYYQSKNYTEALRFFENAIRLNPSMVNAHVYAGAMCYELRNSRKAIYHLENARLLDPDMPSILYILGQSNLDLFEYGLAENNFREALKLKPPADMKTSIDEQLKYLASFQGGSGK